ncbi:threonine synthase [Catenulispora yoronensis]|uniref:Threonine synthase n=1 Tax=Catenulispora yoronensis TaxID=450799 RepID=A0ABN2TLN4_9ACTN
MSSTLLSAPATTQPFGPAVHLSCRECGHTTELGPKFACEECFGPLEISYDFGTVTREQIEAGPASIWRYAPLLPVPADVASRPNTNPGWTRLVRAQNLGRELGLSNLYVKDDSGNPTHSFKDRVVAIAVEAARTFGYTTLSCSSTGNLAGAVGAAAARAGLEACVFIPSDLEKEKVVVASVYGGRLIAIDGTYDEVNRFCSELIGDELGERWGFVNVNLRPYYAEGSKTLAYEIAEQLGWRLPEQIVVPVASGSQLTKIDKGFRELIKLGLVEDTPYKVIGAQGSGCSPVSQAYKDGIDVIRPVKQPDTIAKSLAIGNPADGPYVLDIARRSGGAVEDVTDEQIRAAVKLLARTEGIFAETAGGVTVGVLKKLADEGRLDPDAVTVVINSGDGLKTLDAVSDCGPTAVIKPSLDAFRATL